MSWIHTLVKRSLGQFGLKIHRTPPSPSTYFVPPESCQIAELGHLYELFLGASDSGTFVEVGAFDGITYSNTSCLADKGWTGILIEPVPEFAARCRWEHRDHPNVETVEAAVGDSDTTIRIDIAGPLTTANADLYAEYQEIDWAKRWLQAPESTSVNQVRLDSLLEEHVQVLPLDVLVVDVEGYEREVFAGLDLERYSPRMLIVELSETHADLRTTRASDGGLYRTIVDTGYTVVYKDSVNTVFVRNDLHRQAFPDEVS